MNETVLIENDAYSSMRQLLTAVYPDEGCAVLLGDAGLRRIDEIYPVKNQAPEDTAGESFVTDPKELLKIELEAEKAGKDIIGFCHSHPDKRAVLSEEDIKYMIPGLIYMIFSVTDKGCTECAGYIRGDF